MSRQPRAASHSWNHEQGSCRSALESCPSVNAPRITTIQIDPERIGELIGPGGKVIRAIIEKSKSEINVEDSGTVTIASSGGEANEYAKKLIMDLFADVEPGAQFNGTVKRIADFGVFIEILPGKEGLLHISKMAPTRINSVRDVMNEGDMVEVVVTGVDRQGKIELGRKDLVGAGTLVLLVMMKEKVVAIAEETAEIVIAADMAEIAAIVVHLAVAIADAAVLVAAAVREAADAITGNRLWLAFASH